MSIAIKDGLLHKSSDNKTNNHLLKVGRGEKYLQDFTEYLELAWSHWNNSRFTIISLLLD